jgi:hypothetical protein
MLIGFAIALLTLPDTLGPLHAGPFLNLLIILTGAFVFGALPGLLVGALLTMVSTARARRGRPPSVTVQDLADRLRRPDDAWERMLQHCTRSVRGAEQAIALAPPSPAKDWLTTLHGRMEEELGNAATLTLLARATFPDERDTPSAEAAEHPLHHQLTQAVADFATSRRTIADIVTGLVARPDLTRVDAELAVLRNQLPVLRVPDVS